MTVTLFPRNSGFKLILSRREEKWQRAVNEDNFRRETLAVYCRGLITVTRGGIRILDNVDEIVKWHRRYMYVWFSTSSRPFRAKIEEERLKSEI